MLKIQRKGFTLVEIMIVVAIIGIIIAIAVPSMIGARTRARAKSCMESQAKVDGAVQEWSLENNKATAPTYTDLVGAALYLNKTPICPEAGLTIAVPAVGAIAVCPSTVASHLRP